MFVGGIQENRYSKMKNHKNRLKKIARRNKSPFSDFESKYWNSIYDSWMIYNRFLKNAHHKRIRNVFKNKINRYMHDADYDLTYCKIEAY